MSLTRSAWKSQRCPAGKVRHGSSSEAEIARARMVESGAASPGELKIYFCDMCTGWHLGHPPGYGQRQIEARAARAEGRP
jgi:hypothetical protein